jgi:hypothetical protein
MLHRDLDLPDQCESAEIRGKEVFRAGAVARVRPSLLGWTGEGARPHIIRTSMTPYSFIIASIVEYS